MKNKYLPVIGLEIHVELATKTKMFCDCQNDPHEKHPNINICPICMGHPGTLPTINKEAVRKVIILGLALNGEISEFSRFDRKHYFYPDLPKGYQISQHQHPLVISGYLEIPFLRQNYEEQAQFKKISLTRIHLEEDTAALEHKENSSLIDFNRAGVPLMELVTEPDVSSAFEAKKFAEELQLILRYLNISEASMEKGYMRIEANISLKRGEDKKLGTKVEVKNLNSFKAVYKAIEYEVKRQTDVLENGEKVKQETRGWHDTKEITFSQRSKEEAEDYRYFPEPDLPPLKTKEIEGFNLEKMKNEIIELPKKKRERFKKEFKIKDEQIEIIVSDKKLADYFEKSVSEVLAWIETENLKNQSRPEFSGLETKSLINLCANYLTSDMLGIMKEKYLPIEDLRVTPENFAELIKMVGLNKISSRGAKNILEEMIKTGEDPSVLAEKMNLIQMSNESDLESAAKKIIESNKNAADDFKKGKETALQFLIGQMMKETKGKANPQIAKEILTKLIN